MEEFFEILMSSYAINQAGELDLSICKTIENWNLAELFNLINTSNKGV